MDPSKYYLADVTKASGVGGDWEVGGPYGRLRCMFSTSEVNISAYWVYGEKHTCCV